MILGLTGSVGSGKSTVAEMLKKLAKAVVLDADAMVYEMQKPGHDCFDAIVQEFGSEIVAADGSLDRKKLGAIVFNQPEQLKKLNAIVHPRVWDAMEQETKRLESEPLVVVMVPLLFEIGADRLCEKIAVVTVSEQERIRRLQQRDGLSPKQIQQRLLAQMPQEEKVARAHHVIDNSGTLQETMAQVKTMLNKLGLQATSHQ